MIEIFRETNYDFLSKKWICIGISLAFLLLGLASIFWRAYDGNPNTHPFNLGVDFTGGTIVNAKFKTRPDPGVIRGALEQKGIEGSKITIQPVGDEIGQAPKNEVLIRLPNLSPAERQKLIPLLNLTDEEKKKLNTEGDADIGGRIIRAALETLNDPAVVKVKKDINTISRENLKKELITLDPLKLSAPGETRYQEITDRIIDYREKDRGGLIGSLDELKNLSGLEPQLAGALEQHFYTGAAAIKSTEEVSPQVGGELRQGAIFSSLAACIGMLIYVAYRFKSLGFGIGGVTAVFHDVLMTVGLFSIMQWEINLTVVAALLTLVGFSMNDTIVIFDRIREIMRTKRREGLEKITNIAVNETMSRTVITNGLAFLTILALVLFGGEVLKSFSWALFIGVVVGTYSTVYIASPVMLWWEGWRTKSKSVVAGLPTSGAAVGEQAANLGKSGVTPQMLAAAGISTAQRKHRKKGK